MVRPATDSSSRRRARVLLPAADSSSGNPARTNIRTTTDSLLRQRASTVVRPNLWSGTAALSALVLLDHLHGVKWEVVKGGSGGRPSAEFERDRGSTIGAPVFNPLKPPPERRSQQKISTRKSLVIGPTTKPSSHQ